MARGIHQTAAKTPRHGLWYLDPGDHAAHSVRRPRAPGTGALSRQTLPMSQGFSPEQSPADNMIPRSAEACTNPG